MTRLATTLLLGFVVAAVVAIVPGDPSGQAPAAEVRNHAADEKPAARPNILFCIADDASYPHMGAYGCTWVTTPGFDRVAREGILFTHAYTPNAKCAPSRACILTGRNSWQLEEAANHIPYFPAKFKTYAEALAEHGYFVGYTAKGWAPGNAGTIDGKPRQLAGRPFSKRTTTAARRRHLATRLRRQLPRLPRTPDRPAALLLLVRRLRAASPVRVRLGRGQGRQIA